MGGGGDFSKEIQKYLFAEVIQQPMSGYRQLIVKTLNNIMTSSRKFLKNLQLLGVRVPQDRQVIPPFVIFDSKQLNPLWARDEVPGTHYGLSEKGWIDRELFYGWMV